MTCWTSLHYNSCIHSQLELWTNASQDTARLAQTILCHFLFSFSIVGIVASALTDCWLLSSPHLLSLSVISFHNFNPLRCFFIVLDHCNLNFTFLTVSLVQLTASPGTSNACRTTYSREICPRAFILKLSQVQDAALYSTSWAHTAQRNTDTELR